MNQIVVFEMDSRSLEAKKKKIALHKFFVSGCISFGGGG